MLMNLDFTIIVKQKHNRLEVHKHVVSFIVNFCHSSHSNYSLDEKLCRKKGEMGGYFSNVFMLSHVTTIHTSAILTFVLKYII